MSDDEENFPAAGDMGMGGMGDMGDMGDMSGDDDMDDGYSPPGKLPEGVEKEILTPAPSDNFKKPKAGDEVSVHYVGTLKSDGTEFDSSRGRGEPFQFILGRGQVIKGWDVGVASMKKGELAKFTLAPEFAYGDEGSPPKIPEKATLVFEVELLSWASKDDMFGDEGVIKTELKEGSGWKTPKKDDSILISMKVEKKDGTIVTDKADFEYVVGSESLGVCSVACEKVLMGMKKAEEVSLTCSQDYAEGCEGGATVTLTLKEIFETKDVHPDKNGSLLKKQVKEGEGYNTAKDGCKAKLSVSAATDGTTALPSFAAKVLEFTVGNGEVCDAVEFAVAEMKKGESAQLTVTVPSLLADDKLGLKDVAADKVVLHMELQDFEKAKDTYDMSEEEKVQYGADRKDIGANLFKSGRIEMALQRYKKTADMFNYLDSFKDESNKQKAKDIKKACELNKAACFLKLNNHADAKKSCETVLKDESSNVKALYRKAQADLGLKNYADCILGCKRVVDSDTQNKDARALLKQAQLGQKEDDKKSKGLFANMCKALGKGPIPEPYKAPKKEDDMSDDEEEEDEEEDVPMDDAAAAEAPAKEEPPAKEE